MCSRYPPWWYRPLLKCRPSAPLVWCPGSAALPGSHWIFAVCLEDRRNQNAWGCVRYRFSLQTILFSIIVERTHHQVWLCPTHFLCHVLEKGGFGAFLRVTGGSVCSPSPLRCRRCPSIWRSLRDHRVYCSPRPGSADRQYEDRKSLTPCCTQDMTLSWWRLFVDTLSNTSWQILKPH